MPNKPRSGEKEQEYISRCMSELNSEFPDEKQRAAVCYSKWKESKKSDVLDLFIS